MSVTVLRRLLAQRRLAALLCAVTLLVRLLVPAGYMVAVEDGHVHIELCSGIAARPMTGMPMHVGMPGQAGLTKHGGRNDHGKAEMPCAFAGLSAASLGAVDLVLAVALLAFVLSVWLCPAASPLVVRRVYLRPPLRAPPVFL